MNIIELWDQIQNDQIAVLVSTQILLEEIELIELNIPLMNEILECSK